MPAIITLNQFTIHIDDACDVRCVPDDIQLVVQGMVDGLRREWRPADGHPLKRITDGLMLRLQKALIRKIEVPSNPPDAIC